MAGTTFRESIAAISPSWLRGPVGQRFMYAFAAQFDALADAAIQGVKARWPGVGTDEALPHIGRDRQIDRGPNESTASYVARLRSAFDTWRVAGNAYSVLTQLAVFFAPLVPTLRTVNRSGAWDTLSSGVYTHYLASPGNWEWDSHPERWWRTWVIAYSPSGSPWSRCPTFGTPGFTLGSYSGTIGSTATPSEVASVRAFVKKWKAAHAWVPNVIVALDATWFVPTLPAGDPKLPDSGWEFWSKRVGGVQVRSRSNTALYWDGAV